jgi:hypothetical protein
MAGYNVQTPPLFTVRDPEQLVDFNLATLNATFQHPEKNSAYTTNGSVTYTAVDLLNGYIQRNTSTGTTDYAASATDLIDEIRRRLLAITNKDVMANGTSVVCGYTNLSSYYIEIQGLTGVNVSFPNSIAPGSSAKLHIVVVDQASLGNGHSDEVRIAICGAYEFFNP